LCSESFNQTYTLLRDIPGSVLWQLASHPDGVANECRRAHSLGVDPNRIIAAPIISRTEDLARSDLADHELDAFAYNGHTTTLDALWMDIPVVTMIGMTFASRVAASILHAHGLNDLVMTSIEAISNALKNWPGRRPPWHRARSGWPFKGPAPHPSPPRNSPATWRAYLQRCGNIKRSASASRSCRRTMPSEARSPISFGSIMTWRHGLKYCQLGNILAPNILPPRHQRG
jgi:hypothetical protein